MGKKKLFFKDATQKSASNICTRVRYEIEIESVPCRPIFEKCHLREKGGVLTKIWHSRNRLSRTVPRYLGTVSARVSVTLNPGGFGRVWTNTRPSFGIIRRVLLRVRSRFCVIIIYCALS
jgi:hypothetical protein